MKALLTIHAVLVLSIATAPAGRADVSCSEFDVVMEIKDEKVVLHVESDLPNDTRVMIGVKRGYKENGNASDCTLDYYSAINERLGDWRISHEIPIRHFEWMQALQKKIDELAALDMWEGLDIISDSVVIEVSVPPYRQPNPAFGKNNQKLTGDMVIVRKAMGGEARSIEWKATFPWPLDGPAPKATRVALEDLREGGRYIVETAQGSIPLMLEPKPTDVSSALMKARTLQGKFTMEIRDIREVDNITWYRIQAYYSSGEALASGWINSLALIGNKLWHAM